MLYKLKVVLLKRWCLPVLAYALSFNVSAQAIDEVVLITDSTAITAREFSVLRIIQDQNLLYEIVKPKLGDPITEAIIDEQLLASHAKRIASGAVVSPDIVDVAIKTLAQQNKISAAQLLQRLSVQGVDLEIFRESLRNRLLVQEVIGKSIARSVSIAPSQIQNYINSRPDLRKQIQKSYRLSHMIITFAEGQDEKALKKLRKGANTIRNELLNGKGFGEIITANEHIQSSAPNGDLGWKKKDELPELFINAIQDLQAGEISELVETDNGFHLLALHEEKQAAELPKQFKIRHILKPTPPNSDIQLIATQLNNLKQQILIGIDFASIAKKESVDSASNSKGGELDWLRLEQFGPEIATIIPTLKIGEISAPIQTKFGLHLIEVMKIRDMPGVASLEERVRQRLVSEEVNEKMEDLLNDIKQIAYIEVVE